MKPKLKVENDHAVIQGALTIKHHRELFQIMKKLFEMKMTKVIVEQPSELDLSAIQMLWSLRISTARENTPMNISFNLSESDQRLLTRCGFSFFCNTKVLSII